MRASPCQWLFFLWKEKVVSLWITCFSSFFLQNANRISSVFILFMLQDFPRLTLFCFRCFNYNHFFRPFMETVISEPQDCSSLSGYNIDNLCVEVSWFKEPVISSISQPDMNFFTFIAERNHNGGSMVVLSWMSSIAIFACSKVFLSFCEDSFLHRVDDHCPLYNAHCSWDCTIFQCWKKVRMYDGSDIFTIASCANFHCFTVGMRLLQLTPRQSSHFSSEV